MKRIKIAVLVGFSLLLAASCSAKQDTQVIESDNAQSVQVVEDNEFIAVKALADLQSQLPVALGEKHNSGKYEVLSRKNGQTLTTNHLAKSNAIETKLDGQLYTRASLIAEFEASPAETLAAIEEVYSDLFPLQVPPTISADGKRLATEFQYGRADEQQQNPVQYLTVALGHQRLRQLLQSRFGPQFSDDKFTSSTLSHLRVFLANSQVVSSGASQHSSSAHTYTFCSDGTFFYQYGGSLSFGDYETDGFGAGGTLEDSARGYWDTYSEIGNDAVLLYSTDPGFAEESKNGLLAIPIAAYQEDLIQMGAKGTPVSPDMLLARTPISGC